MLYSKVCPEKGIRAIPANGGTRMFLKKITVALLALITLVCGCAPCAFADDYDMPYYIMVDITNQIVTIYKTEDGTIVRQMMCSSGINDCTPNGTFYLMEKGRLSERGEWTWFQQYHCWVKYATRIYKGYMFHSLPFEKKDESTMIEQMAKEFGMPTSHGCIRLRVDDARFIAKNCLEGTRVTIYKSDTKEDELRELLRISSYTGENGMSYPEFLGYSEDALGRGSAGTQVSDLQYRLRDLGYFEGDITGRYETSTITAVKRVQRDLGLAQTGISSAELLEVIFSDEAPVSAGQATLSEGRSGPVVKKLQTGLAAVGAYSGEIDSVYDLDVSEGVRLFQAACGYPVDGVATAEIQQALYYQIGKLEEVFGPGAIPPAEVVREEIKMATLSSDSNIIIRSTPSTDGENLGKLTNGDTMLVNAVEGDWANVTAKSVTGFVKIKYLKGFTQDNVILRFTGADGKSYQIGHTVAEYNAGAPRVADEFSAIYTSEQFTDTAVETVKYATVNTGADDVMLNLRAEPNSDGEILAQVPNGTTLRVLAEEAGWTRVGYGDAIGYLLNDYLSFHEGSADEVESTAEAAQEDYGPDLEGEGTIMAVVVCADDDGNARVYESGSEDAEIVGKIPAGKQVEVLNLNPGDNWVHIRYKKNEGYMKDANLQFQLIS